MEAPCKNSFCTREASENHAMCEPCRDASTHSQASAKVSDAYAQRDQRIKTASMSVRYPKYYKQIPHGVVELDVYAVCAMFPVQDDTGCINHARKKLLVPGTRTGGKSFYDDVREARDTLNRYLEIMGPQQGKRSEDGIQSAVQS